VTNSLQATSQRHWCSELLSVKVENKKGRKQSLRANLEEIWPSGALVQTDKPIAPATRLWFMRGGYKFYGEVVARQFLHQLGYMIEIRFDPACRWSELRYRPKHLLNPLILLANRIFQATLTPPVGDASVRRQAAGGD
jgi:hypothetical protein